MAIETRKVNVHDRVILLMLFSISVRIVNFYSNVQRKDYIDAFKKYL